MVGTATRTGDTQKPWMVYRKPDGSRDKLFEPGWCGELTEEETERLQKALTDDPDLARTWGWRPSMKRRAIAAIERVAMYGSPDDRSLNFKLVREFSKKAPSTGSGQAEAVNETSSARVKKGLNPSPPRLGRRKVESWEAEMLRLAGTGMGVQKIAKALKAQGVSISGPTVAARLRELKGQLTLLFP